MLPLTGRVAGGVGTWTASGAFGDLEFASTGAFLGFDPSSHVLRFPFSRLGPELSLRAGDGYLFPVGDPSLEDVAILAIPQSTPSPSARARASLPVVYPSTGRVVWLTHANILQSNCITTGELEWAVQYDDRFDWPFDTPVPPAVISGLADGSVVFQSGNDDVARIGPDGELMAFRDGDGGRGAIAMVSEHCGVLVRAGGDQSRYEWWSLDDFSTTSSFPAFLTLPAESPAFYGGETALASCAVVIGRGREVMDGTRTLYPLELVSVGPGDTSWVAPLSDAYFQHPAIPLADGGVVVLQGEAGGVPAPLTVSVFEADGSQRWSHTYDASAGTAWVARATVVTPDGVLYGITTTGNFTNYRYHLVAIDLGAAPGPFDFAQSGMNWARTNAPL